MDSPITSYPQAAVPYAAVQHKAEQQVNGSPKPQDHLEGKKRAVSLSDEVHRLTLTEPPAPRRQPVAVAAPTVVTVPPGLFASAAPNRHHLKTALYNLYRDQLSPADFVLLVNRFGYHAPLHSFPVTALSPPDWLALGEQAILQIVRHNRSFLALLPPEAITANTHLATHPYHRRQLFERVPDQLKEAFFAEVATTCPAAILDMPAGQRTPARLLQACRAQYWLLSQLSAEQRTVELATDVCQRTGYGLQYLPEKNRSYALCLKACQTRGDALEYVPEALKDEELCQIALSKSGMAYKWLPEELASRHEWKLLACQKNGAVLEWMPKDQHTDDLCAAACRSHGEALRFINPKQITYEMCRLACLTAADQACQYIPKRHLDETMRRLICINSISCQTCEDFKPDSADFYEQLLRENSCAALNWVPKKQRLPIHYLLACQKRGRDLALVPFEHRTPEICLAACRNTFLALPWVPAGHGIAPSGQSACEQSDLASVAQEGVGLEWFVETLRHFIDGMYGSDVPDKLLTDARRLLPAADFQSLLQRSLLCSKGLKVAMLTHPQVSRTQKKQLIEWMLEPETWPTPEPPKESDLCEMASPLQWDVANPGLEHLTVAAVKRAAHWAPPRYDAGRQLLAAIEQELCAAVVVQPDCSEPLLHSQGTPAGGRTLKINRGELAHHYKFQRKGESLKTLMQEGVVHTVREKHPELFGPLRSKLPGQSCFFKLYPEQLPFALPKFDDPLAMQKDESGRSYVHVYRYVASTDYSVYAHRADHSHPDNPWHKGEQGLLTACHDIGRFIALGLVPTSTLPAFHDSASRREWIALHAPLGYADHTAHPGTFGAWNSTATEYCDFGYGGFRDVGDFEAFGKIDSFIKKLSSKECREVPEVGQCLSLVNAVCENLLAANLIRARLRQSGSDYHYKNPEAVQQNQAFIERTLLCFLKGMYGDRMESEHDATVLHKRLKLDRAAYEKWLSRTAVEMLYWTAKQPDPKTPERPPFEDTCGPYSHEDGYALHLNRTGRLDPDLYPDDGLKERNAAVYPDHFHNCNGHLNLGRHNALFPLTTLMRGLVRLCTGLLTDDHA